VPHRPAPRPLPESPYPGRIGRLADAAAQAGVSHLLVTHTKDVAYLTGFLGSDAAMVIPAKRQGRVSSGGAKGSQVKTARAVLLSDFRYQEQLEPVREAGIADIFIRPRSMLEAVTEVVRGSKVDRLGIQAEHVTVAHRAALADKLGLQLLADTVGLVAGLRMYKDAHEVKLITNAVRIQEDALEAVLPTIEPGQTELEIAGRLEAEMKARGSSEPGFPTIIAAGAHGSLPHYRPGTAKVAAGKPLLIDWGAVYRGYHSDMTRTFAIGRWNKKIREIYQIVLDAQEAAAAALAPGRTTAEIDGIARDHIRAAGYGDYFSHGLGHGFGLEGKEEPYLTNMLAPSVLQPGQIVTVEPGIYLPGVGGVRIEDDYVITERGAKNLCTLPKTIDWATR
jgi:Xaa-Pro aminopeptidase